jgi:uncharacterized membrane protein YkoI
MKRNIVIATVAAIALAAGGTASAFAFTGSADGTASAKQSSAKVVEGDSQSDGEREDDKEAPVDLTAAKVTAAEAIDAALAKASGTAVSADLGDENGKLVWEIDILGTGTTWHGVQVDPATGSVLGAKTERDEDNEAGQARAALEGSAVTAKEAAVAAASKGTVTAVDLADAKNAAWEVETADKNGKQTDWSVDVKSAKVIAAQENSKDDVNGENESDDSDN